jgi:hypothetical protein
MRKLNSGLCVAKQVSTGHTQWEVPEGYTWDDVAASATSDGADDTAEKRPTTPKSPARAPLRSPQAANKQRSPAGPKPPPPSGAPPPHSPKMTDLPEFMGKPQFQY